MEQEFRMNTIRGVQAAAAGSANRARSRKREQRRPSIEFVGEEIRKELFRNGGGKRQEKIKKKKNKI